MRDGGETAIHASTLRLTDVSGAVLHDTASTREIGSFTFWLPFTLGSGTLKLTQVGTSAAFSVSGQVGNTGGTYSRADDTLTFVHAPGSVYTGISC